MKRRAFMKLTGIALFMPTSLIKKEKTISAKELKSIIEALKKYEMPKTTINGKVYYIMRGISGASPIIPAYKGWICAR